MKFDQTDVNILRELQLNSRLSNKALGDRVHLSAPAVAERVRRMEEAGVIKGYTLDVDPAAMGYPVIASIIVMLMSDKKLAFRDYAQTEPEIVTYDEIPGKADALLRVYCPTIERFHALVDRIHEYGATDCYIHMRNFKRELLLPQADK